MLATINFKNIFITALAILSLSAAVPALAGEEGSGTPDTGNSGDSGDAGDSGDNGSDTGGDTGAEDDGDNGSDDKLEDFYDRNPETKKWFDMMKKLIDESPLFDEGDDSDDHSTDGPMIDRKNF